MQPYIQDIFYSTKNFSKNKIIEIFNEAKDLSDSWHIDIKDEHYKRIVCDMPYNDIIDIFKKTLRKHLHISFIHRREPFFGARFEIGFCTLDRKFDLFLYINLKEEYVSVFKEKYKLEIL